MANTAKDGETVIIKKYANRRLYNTRTSSYITLDHLAQMVKENIDFKVIDAKTGADLTHTILTQIIMDEEAGGTQMLPSNFLRSLFRCTAIRCRRCCRAISKPRWNISAKIR